MKKFLSMLAIAAMVTTFIACSEDAVPDAPMITAPSTTNLQVLTSGDISFTVVVPGGYKSSSIAASGGTAVAKSEPAAGATNGTVVVTFTAGATGGAGSVTLAITDNNNKIGSQTGVVNITALPPVEHVVVSGLIEENTTWTSDKIYELANRVIVTDGVTLTIQKGTIVKGRLGQALNACALMVARGGRLMAVGTADEPIIFTSIEDDIEPGELIGPNLDKDDKGLWGGVILLGKAPISVAGATEAQIEGVPAGETLGLYGGDVADDNSGTLQFVSIRHGGTVIEEGKEINGLTLGGVGSGTTISDIEVFANVDDGVEFFGGSVNISNLLISYQGDDGIDVDQAYSGTVDGFLVVHGGDTDEGLEIDGPEGTANADGKFTLKNGTIIGDPSTEASNAASMAEFKSSAQGDLENVVWSNYADTKKIKILANYGAGCTVGSTNAFSNLVDGDLVFTTVQFTGFGIKVVSNSTANCADGTPADQATAEGLIVSETATGGPAASTWNWSASAAQGLLE